jgi:hypothetical protein
MLASANVSPSTLWAIQKAHIDLGETIRRSRFRQSSRSLRILSETMTALRNFIKKGLT